MDAMGIILSEITTLGLVAGSRAPQDRAKAAPQNRAKAAPGPRGRGALARRRLGLAAKAP